MGRKVKCAKCRMDRENRSTVATCRRGEETKKEKKKVTNGDNSRMRRDAPRSPIAPVFGSSGRVPDVVTHPKFHVDRFRGFAPRGRRKSQFSYTLYLAHWLIQQVWATAQPVIK